MKAFEKKIVRGWIRIGMLLLLILSFWAGDWFSWKLIFSLPLGGLTYACLVVPAVGGTAMAIESGDVKLE